MDTACQSKAEQWRIIDAWLRTDVPAFSMEMIDLASIAMLVLAIINPHSLLDSVYKTMVSVVLPGLLLATLAGRIRRRAWAPLPMVCVTRP